MRAFLFACLAAIVVVIAAVVVLNGFVQQTASTKFSTSAVRL
jgi:hypothetical protein